VGPRAGLDEVPKRKILCPYRKSNPGLSAHSLVTIRSYQWLLMKKKSAIFKKCSLNLGICVSPVEEQSD